MRARGPHVVVGLARSGLAACEAIARVWPGTPVVGVDPSPDVDEARLAAAGVRRLREWDDALLAGAAALVKSPGVPAGAAPVTAARARGVPVLGEVELAWRMLPGNPVIGVTGTNGKTTTTALAGAMLDAAAIPVEVAGNIGRALAELPGRVDADTWIACELSSFQLEDTETFRPRVAVVLNVTPDHLDRHGDFESYAAAKLRILANQGPDDVAVLSGDDPFLLSADLPGAARREWVRRADGPPPGWEASALRGEHNLENALCAAAAARAAGAPDAAVAAALAAFRPPRHRLEPVAEWRGVRFVDDSKATNPEAAMKALTAFPDGMRLILGGSLKGASYDALAAAVRAAPVREAYLIGQAAGPIGEALARAGVPFRDVGDLRAAVRAAADAAAPGETVLLSPACASFDQFRDYEDRGCRFAALAREVAGG